MAREGAWGATVTKAPLPLVPLFASKAPEVGVQGPELTGLPGNRTSVSLPPRELEGLCCQQMAMGKNCCSMYQLADDSSPAVHTSVPVSLSENTAPPTQSNRHPEAEVQLPADHTPAEEEDKLPVLGRTGTEFLRK